MNNWLINELKIIGITRFKLKFIKDLITTHPSSLCKVVEKNNYNGCRFKKKKRKKRKLKIKIYKIF
jgi:hypothetical protein